MPDGLWIEGIQEAQAANNRMMAELKPENAYGRAIRKAVMVAHAGVVRRTHVVTGAYRASHRMEARAMSGSVYIDPASTNPYGSRPAEYGPVEEDRGGDHAAYLNTYIEDRDVIGEEAVRELAGAMP